MAAVPQIAGSFWRGTDGNVWVYGDQGVNNAGTWDNNTMDYWYSRGFVPIADPNPQGQVQSTVDYGSTGSTGGSGGAAAPKVDPNTIALYDQGIGQTQSAIDRLLNQQNIGQENINNDYNSGLTGLNTTKARTTADYTENKTNTTKDNVKAKSNIDYATGRQANSLQRLLGQRGAGSSSASRVAAPYAAALQGTQQRTQVNDAFAQNIGALDKSFNLFNEDWQKSREDLDRQKFRQEQGLQSDIASKRSTLLQTLANLQAQRATAAGGNPVAAAQPYLDQINGLAGQIDNLGRQYQGTVVAKTPSYKAPDLSKYNYDKAQAPQFGQGSALTDTISPYLSVLLGKDKKQQLA